MDYIAGVLQLQRKDLDFNKSMTQVGVEVIYIKQSFGIPINSHKWQLACIQETGIKEP
jgi:hypothetical protein